MKEVIIGHRRFAPLDLVAGVTDTAGLDAFSQEILKIIKKWHEGASVFPMTTSGTTGAKKQINLTRAQLKASAELTLRTLGIDPGDSALLCLDARHIAGLMMIIRAMIGDLKLIAIPPEADPFQQLDSTTKIALVALVPYQAHFVFDRFEKYNRIINGCKAILIGGGPADADLVDKTCRTTAPVYHTFGMTETASHFALRRLNGDGAHDDFRTIPGTEIGVDHRGCLTVRGPMTGNKLLTTNELVEILAHDRFRWAGRIDHVINTGGIKVSPEIVEAHIAQWLQKRNIHNRLLIFGLPDRKLGERLCLAIEGTKLPMERIELEEGLSRILQKYHVPKEIFLAQHFLYTENGKIRRNATKALINTP